MFFIREDCKHLREITADSCLECDGKSSLFLVDRIADNRVYTGITYYKYFPLLETSIPDAAQTSSSFGPIVVIVWIF